MSKQFDIPATKKRSVPCESVLVSVSSNIPLIRPCERDTSVTLFVGWHQRMNGLVVMVVMKNHNCVDPVSTDFHVEWR